MNNREHLFQSIISEDEHEVLNTLKVLDNLDFYFTSGSTPLLSAISAGLDDAAIEMIKNGADINMKSTGQGITPIQRAYIMSQVINPVIKLLIDKGANVNLLDDKNNNIFLLAIESKDSKTVEYLLQHTHVNTNVNTKSGIPALIQVLKNKDNITLDALIHNVSKNQLRDLQKQCIKFKEKIEKDIYDIAQDKIEKAILNYDLKDKLSSKKEPIPKKKI